MLLNAALAPDPERGGRRGGSDFLCLLPILSLWTTEVWSCVMHQRPLLETFALSRVARQTLSPATSLQQLMGSGIVGCLHQFPLGTRGRERGEEAGFVSATCFSQAGRPFGTNIYIYDNQMPHFSLEVEVVIFKGQEQSVVSVVMQREKSSDWALGGNKDQWSSYSIQPHIYCWHP